MVEGTYVCFGNQVNENVANYIICLMKITNGFCIHENYITLSIKSTPPPKKTIQSKVHFLLRNNFEYAVTEYM